MSKVERKVLAEIQYRRYCVKPIINHGFLYNIIDVIVTVILNHCKNGVLPFIMVIMVFGRLFA